MQEDGITAVMMSAFKSISQSLCADRIVGLTKEISV